MQWLLIAMFFLVAWDKISDVIKKRRGEAEPRSIANQPVRVVGETRLATHEELMRADTALKELTSKIEEGFKMLNTRIDTFGSSNHAAHRIIHAKVNSHSNALHFIAGRLSGKGEADGMRLSEILERAREAEEQG